METVAEALAQQILGPRAAFPCGCVLECRTHYPYKDWAYTGCSIHACAEHPPGWVFAAGDFGGGEYRVSVPRRVDKFGKPFLVPERSMGGPLERKWLKPDGTQLTLAELEQAMEENLDRLEREEEERCKKHNADRYRYEGIVGSYGAQEISPIHISRVDPHISSTEGWHVIGRFGSVLNVPMKLKNLTHDGLLLTAGPFRPGDLVDIRKLMKEHTFMKHSNFASIYGTRTSLGSGPNFSQMAAQAYADYFKETWPALANITKGFESRRPTRTLLPNYSELDARLTQQLWVDSEKRRERDSPDLPHDTLLPPLSPPVPEEGEVKGE